MEKCFKCGCGSDKCILVPCKDKGEDKYICSCCIVGKCECEEE